MVKQMKINYWVEDEDDVLIPDEVLHKMGENEKLTRILRSEDIKKVLRDIDGSENRLGTLRSVLSQDKTMKSLIWECVNEMLRSIGKMSEDGQVIL